MRIILSIRTPQGARVPKAHEAVLELGLSLILIADRTKESNVFCVSRRSSREMALLQKRMSSW